jgi:transposase
MSVFLEHFAAKLAPDVHAVMVLDQAGWHGARALHRPPNISLVPLPAYSPELNPVERIWLHLRERYLSHRLLDDYSAVVTACCDAWNALVADTGRIQSLCEFPYVKGITS